MCCMLYATVNRSWWLPHLCLTCLTKGRILGFPPKTSVAPSIHLKSIFYFHLPYFSSYFFFLLITEHFYWICCSKPVWFESRFTGIFYFPENISTFLLISSRILVTHLYEYISCILHMSHLSFGLENWRSDWKGAGASFIRTCLIKIQN